MNRHLPTGNTLHADRWHASMGMRPDVPGSRQPTPAAVDAARPMFGRDGAMHADADGPESGDGPSVHHRMAHMRIAYAASGGLRSVGELACGQDPRSKALFAHMARWIATRDIIGFMWEGEPWVPMFQFDTGPRLRPRRDLQPLFRLLVPLYEPWGMAYWFACANPALSGRRPVDDCASRLSAVMDVAHLEHFIATGQSAASGDWRN